MGLAAQVIAIGPFSREISESLEYPPAFYDEVMPGSTAICNVFITSTSTPSRELAEHMGVGAWELGRHALDLDLDRVNTEALLTSDFAESAPQFLRLSEAVFKFHYLPNG